MTTEEIINDLQPLIAEARERKLWLLCSYQEIYLTPDEIDEEHSRGKFVWGKRNWSLIDPMIIIQHKEAALKSLEDQIKKLKSKIK